MAGMTKGRWRPVKLCRHDRRISLFFKFLPLQIQAFNLKTILTTKTKEELFARAADEFLRLTRKFQEEDRRCRIALAGGSTPRGFYRLLAQAPFRESVPWNNLWIFWGDERTVPPDHADSNYAMAAEALLNHVPIPTSQIFRIEGELPPEEAARKYEHTLYREFSLSTGEIPQFDLILLGMGPDGHTASLFPGLTDLLTSQRLVEAPWVEKFHSHRITLTPRVLNGARKVVFLVSGAEKAQTVQAVLEGPSDVDTYPVQVVDPSHGDSLWIVEDQAAALLEPDTVSPLRG